MSESIVDVFKAFYVLLNVKGFIDLIETNFGYRSFSLEALRQFLQFFLQ